MTLKELESSPIIVVLTTRIEFLEEELDKLTEVVKAMSDRLIRIDDRIYGDKGWIENG